MQAQGTWISKLSLAGLVAISVLLFWLRFRRVAVRILRARRDDDFHLGSLGGRAWNFFLNVLCQAKVIRERPLPGFAHAVVFWGFCAFALVTLNHLASGFGLPFLNRTTWWGSAYFWFVFVFAAAVAVAIAGLAFRRFIIRPRWLGPLSYESGVIALLIFVLMVTYMGTVWVPEQSV